MVEVFREVKRVLRDDGVVWLNYGDCYASSGGQANRYFDGRENERGPGNRAMNIAAVTAGSLMMMPHRVALALQADGWIVRQDLVWYKRNPMPESVRGWSFNPDGELRKGSFRHTRAHEYVFMLTKQRQYWSDQEAVREAHQHPEMDHAARFESSEGGFVQGIWHGRAGNHPSGRNPRSVLDVPTSPYKGAHYATFPPNLIAPLIRATCPRWACPVCGQGWAAVVEQRIDGTPRNEQGRYAEHEGGDGTNSWLSKTDTHGTASANVLGYRPTCSHKHTQEEALPGIVFDPFLGSGTTVKVAQDLLRRGIGIDISMEYLDLQAKIRTGQGSPSNQFENLPLFD